MFNPQENRVLFVSKDGINFKLYVDGYLINGTRGVTIQAGEGEEVVVTPSLVGCVDNFIKENTNFKVNTMHGLSTKEIAKELNSHISKFSRIWGSI